jgi:hypothetical protein
VNSNTTVTLMKNASAFASCTVTSGSNTCTVSVPAVFTPTAGTGDKFNVKIQASGTSVSTTFSVSAFTWSLTQATATTSPTISTHVTYGQVTAATSGVVVQFPGSSGFSDSNSFACTATSQDNTASIRIQNGINGSSITVTSSTGSPNVSYICVGY